MKNIPERVEKEIIQLAKQYDIQKVILFGSRARGDNWERSDIDLAVSGGDIPRFALDLDEEVWTLLLFDVVNLDEPVQPALLKEIARDGVLIYEKCLISNLFSQDAAHERIDINHDAAYSCCSFYDNNCFSNRLDQFVW